MNAEDRPDALAVSCAQIRASPLRCAALSFDARCFFLTAALGIFALRREPVG